MAYILNKGKRRYDNVTFKSGNLRVRSESSSDRPDIEIDSYRR